MYYYNYGFVKAEENKRNPKIIDIYFGYKEMPYHIHKERTFDFLMATMPFLRHFSDATIKNFKRAAKKDPVDLLNRNMEGMPIIFATEFNSYDEYINGCQNHVVGVTSMDLNGKMNEVMIDDVKFEELYPKRNLSDSDKNSSNGNENSSNGNENSSNGNENSSDGNENSFGGQDDLYLDIE